MLNLSPVGSLYMFIVTIMAFIILFTLNASETVPIHPLVFKSFWGFWTIVLFWWPIDLMIHWEKITETSMKKDRLLACVALAVIFFIYPYHWLGTPFIPTLGAAVFVGVFLPGLYAFLTQVKNRRMVTEPGLVYRAGMLSPRAQEFLHYFPHAKQYVYGYTEGDGNLAHLIMHHRQPYPDYKDAQIDFVMDVIVDRRLGRYQGGQERLQCYIFVNQDNQAGVGFLPSMNIGRALDYGFSESEIENAIAESSTFEQKWAVIGREPIAIQHFPGKYVCIR